MTEDHQATVTTTLSGLADVVAAPTSKKPWSAGAMSMRLPNKYSRWCSGPLSPPR